MRLLSYLVVIFALGTGSAQAVFFDTLDPVLGAKPESFVVVNLDYIYGSTTTGETFTQMRIVSDSTIRIHHFTMGSLSYYISDKGVFSASSDLKAISIYLTLT